MRRNRIKTRVRTPGGGGPANPRDLGERIAHHHLNEWPLRDARAGSLDSSSDYEIAEEIRRLTARAREVSARMDEEGTRRTSSKAHLIGPWLLARGCRCRPVLRHPGPRRLSPRSGLLRGSSRSQGVHRRHERLGRSRPGIGRQCQGHGLRYRRGRRLPGPLPSSLHPACLAGRLALAVALVALAGFRIGLCLAPRSARALTSASP